jgi:adenylosuccinate lyase
VVHSQKVLLALTQGGMSREDAYATVQRNAMATWENLGTPQGRSFRDNLLADPKVTALIAPEALDGVMDPQRDFTHVRATLVRVFAEAT